MSGFKRIVSLIGLAVVILALVEPARLAWDWWELRGYLAEMDGLVPLGVGSAESFDWVIWDDADGQIEARFVFPKGPGASGGIQEGDAFYMLDNIQYFAAEDLRHAVRGAGPGRSLAFLVERGGAYHDIEVQFGRFPTFLYPRSQALWQFALWGFAIGAFFHILALFIAAPLARRSKQARTEFILIAVSAVWIVGNLARLLAVEVFGPPTVPGTYDAVFQGLTLLGLVGWIGFPIFLLDEVMCSLLERPARAIRTIIAVPPVLLGLAVVSLTLAGHLGPLTMESLLAPILVYASCYMGGAALAVIAAFRYGKASPDEGGAFGGWGLAGSIAIFISALAAALSVQEVVPVLDRLGDIPAGWLIVLAQLLAVAPVTMLSFGTLRHGKVDDILSRALVYATVLGLIFFAFVAGYSLLDQYLGGPSYVLGGVLVVVLLLIFDRLIRRLRGVAETVFRTERQTARQLVVQLQERMPDVLEAEALMLDVASAAGKGLGARSAVLFVSFAEPGPRWRSASHHPEPPYLTERVFQEIWPFFQTDSRVWARNPELDAKRLPPEQARRLTDHGAALAVPIRAEGKARGLLVLGIKQKRGAVYNLEDVDVLRALAGHLAVAAARIDLVERERRLARETAQAQLVALRAQINPHFLFNALNTILSHIAEKPETAEAAVEHLAAIFRYTLTTEDRAFVPLKDEFALVGNYLAIEKARFGSNLDVHTSIEAGLEHVPVPAFCVQTLVENAVKHGIERRRGGGKLRVEAITGPDGPAVRVTDTGVGIPGLFGRSTPTTTREDFFGIGLKNVHARMELLYGRQDLLEMESDPETGTIAILHLPSSVPNGNGKFISPSNESITT
ncbi:MAG: two-component system LytT family sensor kinase [Rhodothermales bacterium]|jgi:two-component system LytT family sensor kinase